jgi:hypothetical protein
MGKGLTGDGKQVMVVSIIFHPFRFPLSPFVHPSQISTLPNPISANLP